MEAHRKNYWPTKPKTSKAPTTINYNTKPVKSLYRYSNFEFVFY